MEHRKPTKQVDPVEQRVEALEFLGKVFNGEESDMFHVRLMRSGHVQYELDMAPLNEVPSTVWYHGTGSYAVARYDATTRTLEYDWYEV